MSETMSSDRFGKGDLEGINEVADLQEEAIKDGEREEIVAKIVAEANDLAEDEQMSISASISDPETEKLLYYKLGVDPSAVEQAKSELLESRDNSAPTEAGNAVYKPGTPEWDKRLENLDLDRSTKAAPIKFDKYKKYVPISGSDLAVSLSFSSPADPTIMVSLEKHSDLDAYVQQLADSMAHPEAPLSSGVDMSGVVARGPESDKQNE